MMKIFNNDDEEVNKKCFFLIVIKDGENTGVVGE